MTAIPQPSWLAGPDISGVECPSCGGYVRVEPGCELETWPCQGDDSCEARMCGNCREKCDSCDLPACKSHMADFSGQRWCTACLRSIEDDADQQLAEERETVRV